MTSAVLKHTLKADPNEKLKAKFIDRRKKLSDSLLFMHLFCKKKKQKKTL